MQRSAIAILSISCALITYGVAQTSGASGTPVPRVPRAEKQAAIASKTGNAAPAGANPDAVGMNQPVITLKGGCTPIGDITPAKDCVSDLTRAQFEKLTNALQPGMVPEAKRGFATNYGRLLVYSDAARALNLENDPNVQQILAFVTNQVLAEGLKRYYAEKFAHPTDQQIQNYYDQNSTKYLEVTLQRLIIPRHPGSAEKPAPSDADQKAAAVKFRERWVAGEDPVKLQQAAYEAIGVTGAGTPEINLGPRRTGSLPAEQETVFQLKAGEISAIYSDPAAFYIYKAVSARQIPLSEVKDAISKTLQQQQLQDKLTEIGKSATPVLNDEYFGVAEAPGAELRLAKRLLQAHPLRQILQNNAMTQPPSTVLVTGVSGNLGTRLVPMLGEFRVVGVDLHSPDSSSVPVEFHSMNLGHESSCRELTQLLRQTGASSVVHLAFVVDPQRTGVLDIERMWQINVAGTARVMEAVSVVNRTGGKIQQFIFPSSVSAYGPETPGPVKEDFPLRAHTLPYAIHKRESDEIVRYRAESLGDCRTYILRPHIFTGASMQNYLVGALRGTPLGKSPRAARMRAEGKRLPLMLPRGKKYPEQRFQFVHVDDVARLLVYLLHRPHNDPPLTILNVAAHGEPLSIQTCAEIAHANIRRVPSRAACRMVLRMLWKWGISSIPPEALPYMIGSYTMDTARLQEFLGRDYPQVIRHSVEEAFRDSFVQSN